MVQRKIPRKAVIGVDIGGTKTAYGVFEVINGRIIDNPIISGQIDTKKGAEGLKMVMADIYKEAITEAHNYDIIAVGVGAPGRPVLGSNAAGTEFVVAPNSTNLIAEFSGEFDNVNMQPLLKGDIPVPVYVTNDAIAQMQAMLTNLLGSEGKTQFYGEKIAYIGLGTGLGGGFAEVDKNGGVAVNTDGHIWDICLELSPSDMKRLHTISDNLKDDQLLFDKEGKAITAQILGGASLAKITGHTGKELGDNPELIAVYHSELELIGRCLAELVIEIHKGNFKKLTPDAEWTTDDLNKVKGTTKFLIGGGIASNDTIMRVVLGTAQKELEDRKINGIKFVTAPDKNVTLAAAASIPHTIVRQVEISNKR